MGSYIGTRGTTRVRNINGREDFVNVIIIYAHRVRLKCENTFIRFTSQFGNTKLGTYCKSNEMIFLVSTKVMKIRHFKCLGKFDKKFKLELFFSIFQSFVQKNKVPV